MEQSAESSKNGKSSFSSLAESDQDMNKDRGNVVPAMEDNVNSITSEIVFQIRKRLEEFTAAAANQRYPPRYTRSVNLDYRASDAFRMPNRISRGRSSVGSSLPFECMIAFPQEKGTGPHMSDVNLVALSSAFKIVRRILLRVSELLQQFSNRLDRTITATAIENTESESRMASGVAPGKTETVGIPSERTDPQYNQYVYQIAFYILEILGEQLNNFGSIMNFTSPHVRPNMDWQLDASLEPSFSQNLWSSDSEESATSENEPNNSGVLKTRSKTYDKIKSFGRESLRGGRKLSTGVKRNIADALEVVCDVFNNVFDYLTENTSRPSSPRVSQQIASRSTPVEEQLSSEDTPDVSSVPTNIPTDRTIISGSRGDATSRIRDLLSGSKQGLFGTPGDRFYPESASTVSSGFYGNRMEDINNSAMLHLCDSCRKESDEVLKRNRANSFPLQKVSTVKEGERRRALSDDVSDKLTDIKPFSDYITQHLPDDESREHAKSLQEVSADERGAISAETQTSCENQTTGRTIMGKGPLTEAVRKCANRIIDDLIQIASIISIEDENSGTAKCAECDTIIYIDVSEEPINVSYAKGSINFNNLLYNPGESDDPNSPCVGFYVLPDDRETCKGLEADRVRDSDGTEVLVKTETPVVNILSLDLNEFTDALREKFREFLSIAERGAENNAEEYLNSSFVNEKAILRILLECCQHASQNLKESDFLLQDECNYSPGRDSSKGKEMQSAEVGSNESLVEEEEEEEDDDDESRVYSRGTPTDKVPRDSAQLFRTSDSLEEEEMEPFYFKERQTEERSSTHTHITTYSSKCPNYRVRFVSDVKDSDGPSRPNGEHLEDVGFYFSEIDTDLSYMWDENDRHPRDFLEPHPHVIIHQEDEFPHNVLEVREAMNGRIYRYLEEWHEETENLRTETASRYQDIRNVPNRGVPLHPVPERTHLSINNSFSDDTGLIKISRGDHALPPTAISMNSGLAFMKSTKRPDPEGKTVCSQSINTASWPGNYPFTAEDAKRRSNAQAPSGEWNLLCKIWQFWDERRKDGFGRGPPLLLILHRHCAVEEAFAALLSPSELPPLTYYRDLRVTFKDQHERREESHDACQELFSLLSDQLFSRYHYGLFDHPSFNSLALYLNPASRADEGWFRFAGTILALALLHQKQMGVTLPVAFFKCILDRPFTLNDVKEVDPDLYVNLKWLQQNKVSGIDPPLTFVIRDKCGDISHDFELIPEGSSVRVSDANKFGYIEKAIKWKLAERSFCQIKEFRRGFLSILEPHMLFIFTADELQYLTARSAKDGPLGDDTNTPVRRSTW